MSFDGSHGEPKFAPALSELRARILQNSQAVKPRHANVEKRQIRLGYSLRFKLIWRREEDI
jgi:hypothetical protein